MLQWMIDSWEYWINLIELLLFYFYIHSKLTPNPAIKHQAACKALFLALIFTAECVLNNRGASVYPGLFHELSMDIAAFYILVISSFISLLIN